MHDSMQEPMTVSPPPLPLEPNPADAHEPPVGVVVPEPVAVAVPVAERAAVERLPVDLEIRVEALERKVDHLNNSPEFEERITTRVLERLPQSDRWYAKLNPFRGVTAAPVSSGWFLYDLLSELRFIGAMVFDHRFSMSWLSRGLIVGSLVLAFTTWFWLACVASIPILGGIVTTSVILICGGLVYKTLNREAARYRSYLEMYRK